ncbi:MAG: hypothetical protein ABSA34_00115 [Candidatus Goldiibacteriota bacterium]
MSAHTASGVQKNAAIREKMKFSAGLTSMVNSYEKKAMQIKCFFNGIETSKGIMGLMVDLTNVRDIFNIRIEVTGAGSPELCAVEAEKVMKGLEEYFA